MRGRSVGVYVAALVLAGCGGGSGGSPTSPSATSTTSVTVTLPGVVLMGTTAVATAVATLSNGQTQAVTTGWRSDATSVATVTDSGTVTGITNGEATIIAASGGREGTRRIRVAPNYAGTWQGVQLMTGCAATGIFAGICEDDPIVGEVYSIDLTARQSDLNVSGEFNFVSLPFPTFATVVESDGVIRFASTTRSEDVQIEVSWMVTSAEGGVANGTIRERYTAPDFGAGELTYDSTLSNFRRAGGALRASPGAHTQPARINSRMKARISGQ